ncbi:RNA-binding protein 1-like [Momordica charantia]|uniref:RNA-binding protein 1-like n=1 Tax=Momordica charantia TaxID=3673 RepID=A0A6J1C724_MOMCH|nr:RNA-binding protein 1-like [Momordica charantia]XP_022137022.1 RNA-binding protein 1-like [Momordica charantia]XP_022137089.1 RNA-binding protein 1-like [Momordica charantia]
MNKSSNRMESNNDQSRGKKIFVGGLPSDLTENEFKSYFEKFGQITDVVVMQDSVTNRPRGFGFITFDSVESVNYVLQNNFHELNGRRVEVKRAVPKNRNCNSSNPQRGKSPLSPHVPLYYPHFSSGPVVYPGYAPFPHYYGSSLYGSWHYNGLYGTGHEAPPLPLGSAWYAPNVFGDGMFPSPYINSVIHPVYSSKGGRLLDPMAGNGRRNGNMSADAVPFQLNNRA